AVSSTASRKSWHLKAGWLRLVQVGRLDLCPRHRYFASISLGHAAGSKGRGATWRTPPKEGHILLLPLLRTGLPVVRCARSLDGPLRLVRTSLCMAAPTP